MRAPVLHADCSKGSHADFASIRTGLPPVDSRLVASLERGQFAKSFTSCAVIGKGGFGQVVKAWNTESQQWQAVKFIPIKLMADETVDEDNDVWCGAELFQQLLTLRCPHVLKYFRRWTELPEDIRDALPEGSGILSPTWSTEADEDDESVALPAVTGRTVMTLAKRAREENLGSDDEESEDHSDGGFEWDKSSALHRSSASTARTAHEQRQACQSPGGCFDAVLVIQMEYWDGQTLGSWLTSPPTRHSLLGGGVEAVLALFAQLIAGLAELHEKGIVHRDVKPQNIIVSEVQGQLKLIDFGLARPATDILQELQERRNLAGRRVSLEFTSIGTPGYAPPEQCCSSETPPLASPVGREAAPCADVFSAGIVLVELLMAAVRAGPAWRTAMERASAMRDLHAGYKADLPAELLRAPEIPGWLRRLVMRMLARDVALRPSSHEVLREVTFGLDQRTRSSPYVCSLDVRAGRPELQEDKIQSFASTKNPYIGFFLDHRTRKQS